MRGPSAPLSRLEAPHADRCLGCQVWNPALLTISGNPTLRRIVLSPTEHEPSFARAASPVPLARSTSAGGMYPRAAGAEDLDAEEAEEACAPVVGTGQLWMREAMAHPRLRALVRFGTCVLALPRCVKFLELTTRGLYRTSSRPRARTLPHPAPLPAGAWTPPDALRECARGPTA